MRHSSRRLPRKGDGGSTFDRMGNSKVELNGNVSSFDRSMFDRHQTSLSPRSTTTASFLNLPARTRRSLIGANAGAAAIKDY